MYDRAATRNLPPVRNSAKDLKAVAGYFCWTLVLLYTFVTPSTEWAI